MGDIARISNRMRVLAEHQFSEYGLGYAEQVAIMHLAANDGCTQESVARALEIDKGSIARTLAKLEEKGFVTREVNENNRREKLVSIAPAAQSMIARMNSNFESLEKTMFAGLSEEQVEQLESYLAVVANNLATAGEGE